MNTRQKLTLGIAAIFMVTLTIVGVTYAYFVTQVEEEAAATVDVTTATFGDIEFVKAGNGITLDSMATGESESMTFTVRNTGDSDLMYDLVLKYEEDEGKPTFIRTLETEDGTRDTEKCYNLADGAEVPTDCSAGKYYDNIHVKIVRAGETDPIYDGPLSATTPLDIDKNISIGSTAHEYTITVTHLDAEMNQNLEQNAYIKIIPDIDDIDPVTNEPAGE